MDKISRTKKKKAAQGLQKIGEQLVDLNDAQLDGLDLPPDLKKAVAETRRFKSHGARRRQLQYIGRLMRNYDAGVVQEALLKIAAKEDQNRRRFKLAERWRDELVGGDDDRRTWLLENFPAVDPQHLDQLISHARGVADQMKTKEAARQLFRFLFNHLHQFVNHPIHE